MIHWIHRRLALAVHRRHLTEHGGKPGVRDSVVLDTALVKPQWLYAHGAAIPDIAALASRLTHGLARERPFVDGNTGTALVCCRLFLGFNDTALFASDDEKRIAITGVADGSLTEDDFTDWIRWHLALSPRIRVSESRKDYGPH